MGSIAERVRLETAEARIASLEQKLANVISDMESRLTKAENAVAGLRLKLGRKEKEAA